LALGRFERVGKQSKPILEYAAMPPGAQGSYSFGNHVHRSSHAHIGRASPISRGKPAVWVGLGRSSSVIARAPNVATLAPREAIERIRFRSISTTGPP
jgi:hypothetical protein